MIHVPINLASEPFQRTRAVVAASAAGCVALLLLLVVQVSHILSERGQAAETRAAIGHLDRQLKIVGSAQGRLDATLLEPVNAEVLDRSLFFNTVILRKSISWTRLFADLEQVVPNDVRLVSVRLPEIDTRNRVLLDMVVGANDAGSVVAMIKRLQASPLFGPTAIHSSMPPSQSETLTRYRLSVTYAQKL
jgi:type IV pilus assembly protein PilN